MPSPGLDFWQDKPTVLGGTVQGCDFICNEYSQGLWQKEMSYVHNFPVELLMMNTGSSEQGDKREEQELCHRGGGFAKPSVTCHAHGFSVTSHLPSSTYS